MAVIIGADSDLIVIFLQSIQKSQNTTKDLIDAKLQNIKIKKAALSHFVLCTQLGCVTINHNMNHMILCIKKMQKHIPPLLKACIYSRFKRCWKGSTEITFTYWKYHIDWS